MSGVERSDSVGRAHHLCEPPPPPPPLPHTTRTLASPSTRARLAVVRASPGSMLGLAIRGATHWPINEWPLDGGQATPLVSRLLDCPLLYLDYCRYSTYYLAVDYWLPTHPLDECRLLQLHTTERHARDLDWSSSKLSREREIVPTTTKTTATPVRVPKHFPDIVSTRPACSLARQTQRM